MVLMKVRKLPYSLIISREPWMLSAKVKNGRITSKHLRVYFYLLFILIFIFPFLFWFYYFFFISFLLPHVCYVRMVWDEKFFPTYLFYFHVSYEYLKLKNPFFKNAHPTSSLETLFLKKKKGVKPFQTQIRMAKIIRVMLILVCVYTPPSIILLSS